MIKTRKAGVWQDVTLYKARVAGVWTDVILGKRYYDPVDTTRVAKSLQTYLSATASTWETIAGATSTGSMTWNGTTGAYPASAGQNGTSTFTAFNNAKFYIEVAINVSSIGISGLPAVVQIQDSGSFGLYDFVLVADDGGYNLALKDLGSEEVVYSTGATLALNTTYTLAVEVDVANLMARFFVNSTVVGTDQPFGGSIFSGDFVKMFVGDVAEGYGPNRFVIYRAVLGTHTNTISSGV